MMGFARMAGLRDGRGVRCALVALLLSAVVFVPTVAAAGPAYRAECGCYGEEGLGCVCPGLAANGYRAECGCYGEEGAGGLYGCRYRAECGRYREEGFGCLRCYRPACRGYSEEGFGCL